MLNLSHNTTLPPKPKPLIRWELGRGSVRASFFEGQFAANNEGKRNKDGDRRHSDCRCKERHEPARQLFWKVQNSEEKVAQLGVNTPFCHIIGCLKWTACALYILFYGSFWQMISPWETRIILWKSKNFHIILYYLVPIVILLDILYNILLKTQSQAASMILYPCKSKSPSVPSRGVNDSTKLCRQGFVISCSMASTAALSLWAFVSNSYWKRIEATENLSAISVRLWLVTWPPWVHTFCRGYCNHEDVCRESHEIRRRAIWY